MPESIVSLVMSGSIERVHVVFKTHLDIGFTDLARNIVERYLRVFIPKALDAAEELEGSGGTERFVWTTGSWLIDEYLRRAGDPERERMERAIRSGGIAWHAMPFTTHSELMDPWLADSALAISARLDERFGRKTIAAKLTDVPGHTIGLVPILAGRGVRYLHVGVNDGSRVPEVPRLFRWRAPDGSEVLVHYSAGYGDELAFPGLADALVIAHSSDNSGPPSAAEAKRILAGAAGRYAGASVFASTLDAFAERLLPLAPSLPLVEGEIGDTWIHGAATDPRKLAGYRALLRRRAEWASRGGWDDASPCARAFARNLLLIAEHTWGLDTKKYLGDYRNWSKAEFAAARARDRVGPDAAPEEFRSIEDHARGELSRLFPDDAQERWARRSFSFFESSHAEQRAYLDQAIAALPSALRAEADETMARIASHARAGATVSGGAAARAGDPLRLGPYLATFGTDGSIASLRLADDEGRGCGAELAGPCGIGALSYQALGPEDYEAYHKGYNRNLEENSAWVLSDFGKPGMGAAEPRPPRGFYAPRLEGLRFRGGGLEDEAVCELSFPEGLCAVSGAPREASLRFAFPAAIDGTMRLELSWRGKDPNRLPEALWLSFDLAVESPGLWRLVKIGQDIDPASVVPGGNRACHAVQAVSYRGPGGLRRVEPEDSALVAIGERRLLCSDDRFSDPSGGLHFALYDNLWGTNFPQWYGEDACFGFNMRIERSGFPS
jgi:hypothetical protein